MELIQNIIDAIAGNVPGAGASWGGDRVGDVIRMICLGVVLAAASWMWDTVRWLWEAAGRLLGINSEKDA